MDVYKREGKGPDGNGIGPALEARDVLWILERHAHRPIGLENLALDMGARLLELSGKYEYVGALELLRERLESGKALQKFWEIGFAQGAEKSVKSEEIRLGEYTFDLRSDIEGKVVSYDNHHIVRISRALGAPFAKRSGLYVHKNITDRVAKGDVLATLYADSSHRLELAKEYIAEIEKPWVVIE